MGHGYIDAFENRTPVAMKSIKKDDSAGAQPPGEIEFTPRDNPDISVGTSGRYAKHEIIGGTTVRQKIGEDPVNITVKGVCDEDTAIQIDKLRNAKSANFISDRISQTVQVGSTKTSPLTQGGAADMDTGDLLYNYTLNLIGIEAL